ncbi:PTS mannose/fructose/sorbose/N-acetylgalactosamine transporter subunit IIC [Breznakia pachnodae]|uniref:PTS system N-acetylgalactosamine-specific IIC component n=1 Tax=Breznakia pachnodae TaxID=265178 RepID=A0ABU0E3Q7_9FIRM|nr:PTS sugar transporter subunit IIC [Breznakia pachnodae]MDQ0361440.1 PTS system N-acetylgalactosamine-specific IIC component [Breznakia pachnodae]
MADFNIIEVLLLAVVTFILAIDQFSFTELLYRPIVACTLIGLVLGDANIGLVVGGTYELIMIGNMPIGGAQPPNAVIGGVMAVIFAVKSGIAVNAAIGLAIPFSLFGQYAVTLTFTLMSGLMVKADKAAAEADPDGIVKINLLSMAILGGLFVVIALLGYFGGAAFGTKLTELSEDFGWLMGGLDAAGGMMRYVGFATLMKIMISSRLWGFYFMGFVMAVILGQLPALGGSKLLLIAVIAVGIAIYDFQSKISQKQAVAESGGDANGI